jgi:murein DD-endopeptidase MepM/ murein hydrolase activator NlpD
MGNLRFTDILGVLAVAAFLGGCAARGAAGSAIVLSGYRAMHKPGGAPRTGAHPAIDFDGAIGDPVLAAADGTVVQVLRDGSGAPCGNGIKLWHSEFNRVTLYCQLHELRVELFQGVVRGQVIGLLGNSGEPSWFPSRTPMLHFGLQDSTHARHDGDLQGTFDPASFIVGCFEPGRAYPADRLVLTYPVRCTDAK